MTNTPKTAILSFFNKNDHGLSPAHQFGVSCQLANPDYSRFTFNGIIPLEWTNYLLPMAHARKKVMFQIAFDGAATAIIDNFELSMIWDSTSSNPQNYIITLESRSVPISHNASSQVQDSTDELVEEQLPRAKFMASAGDYLDRARYEAAQSYNEKTIIRNDSGWPVRPLSSNDFLKEQFSSENDPSGPENLRDITGTALSGKNPTLRDHLAIMLHLESQSDSEVVGETLTGQPFHRPQQAEDLDPE